MPPVEKQKRIEKFLTKYIATSGHAESSLERSIRATLDRCGVGFEYHKQFRTYIADIYIPDKKLVIEVDGCYWHGCDVCGYQNKKQEEKDKRRDKWFAAHGYEVVRIKGHDIKTDPFNALKKGLLGYDLL
jgi:very-short-patch-repair endonuclease